MRELLKALKGHKVLVFLDLEGTGISHEMIEIGAYKVNINDDASIKKIHKPYKAYVKAKHPIGSYVTKLTGITEKMLKEKGISFRQVQADLKKYLKKDYGKCLYVTFGPFDKTIMLSSAENNMDSSMEEARNFVKNHFDLCAFVSRFIKGEDGNPMSQSRLLTLFGEEEKGTAHDACDDALNMITIYKDLFTKKALLATQYEKAIRFSGNMPLPAKMVLNKLQNGESVTPEDYKAIIEEAVK